MKGSFSELGLRLNHLRQVCPPDVRDTVLKIKSGSLKPGLHQPRFEGVQFDDDLDLQTRSHIGAAEPMTRDQTECSYDSFSRSLRVRTRRCRLFACIRNNFAASVKLPPVC